MTKLLLRLFVKNYDKPKEPAVRSACGTLASLVGIGCNILLFALKLIAGLLSGSVAITADAVNNLSDAASSIVTLLGFQLAKRPADAEHPYGHARMEYLSGLAVAALILVIGVELGKSSLDKIFHPESVTVSLLTVGILLASIGLKLWLSLFCRKIGKHIDSAALVASAADSRNDVISTAAVLLSCLISRLFDLNIDGYVGLLVAAFIIWSGWGIAKDTISPLLGEQADPELVKALSELILSHEKVLGIHDLMVHDYGPGQCFASVHAEMCAGEDPLVCHDILDDVERDALEKLRIHLVMHYDPVVTDDPELNRLRSVIEIELHGVSNVLSLHDFRMVQGPGHTNLIFDLVIPFSMRERKSELKARIDARLAQESTRYYTVITFDEAG